MVDHEDYKVIADLTDHIADASAHHVRYSAAEARAAINNIFGSDGKADADIDLDGHDLKGGSVILPNGEYIGIGAALERLEFYTAGYAAFMDCWVGIGTATPNCELKVIGQTGTRTLDVQAYPLLAGSKPLRVWGYDNESVIYPFYATDENANIDFYIATDGAGGANVFMYFRGNFGIGTETPTTGKLVVKGGHLDVADHNALNTGLKLAGTLITVSAAEINFLKEISYGIDDSGGAGFKVLRVPN